jgi:integrase
MGTFKRGDIYWYKFMFNGQLIRESTRQGSDKVARQMESAHRTRLSKDLDQRKAKADQFGCPGEQLARCPECEKWFDSNRSSKAADGKKLCSNECRKVWDRKATPVPTVKDFCDLRFAPWAKASFEHTCRNNWYWFRAGIRALTAYEPFASCKIDEITNEKVTAFAAHEQSRPQLGGKPKKESKRGLAVSSINGTIRVLRRMLSFAVECGVIQSAPKLTLLGRENHRDRVITPNEEALYLAAAPPLMSDVASVLADTGLRPDECYRLEWQSIIWGAGRFGILKVTSGKTAAANRKIPMTPRVRGVLEMRWERANRPDDGWVFPAPTESGHIERDSLKKQHARTFITINAQEKDAAAESKKKKPRIRPFLLYAFRHTFLTRLGESGCDAWTLARIAGHSSIAISMRYVHPSDDAVLNAVSNLGRHKIGHNAQSEKMAQESHSTDVIEIKGDEWCARRDSNSRPVASEATALSS